MFEGKKVLIVTPHLSTGGSPQYLLEFLRENKDKFSDFLLVEHSNFSDEFVVQKNKIINLIGKCNHVTLGRYGETEPLYTLNRSKLIDIIEEFKPEVIWMNECPESYEYQLPPENVLDYIYQKSRDYKIVETTHYNAFDFSQKRYIPDEFMFCSEKHMMTSSSIDIPKTVWEVPIHIKERPNREKTLVSMGLDPNMLHILNVGLFNGNKNQKYIFDLAKEFLDKNVMFHFVGNSCFFEECGIGEDINLPNCKVWGERDDVDNFMSCMDIYLFPSKKELNPLTVKEALSWDMEVVVNRDDNYVFQYKGLDNFHILDEIDIHEFIDTKLNKLFDNLRTINKGSKNIVLYCDEGYHELALNTIESFDRVNDTFTFYYYTVDFTPKISNPNVKVIPITKPLGLPNIMLMKPLVISKVLDLVDDLVYVDCDLIASKHFNYDDFIGKVTNVPHSPLLHDTEWQYPIYYWYDGDMRHEYNESFLMEFLGVKNRTQKWATACMMGVTKNCKKFIDEWVKICFTKELWYPEDTHESLKQKSRKYFHIGDEGPYNVLLWKNNVKCNYTKGIVLEPKEISTILKIENNKVVNQKLEPNNPMTECIDSDMVYAYHQIKDLSFRQEVLNKLRHKQNKFLLVCSFYNNTKEHVENTFVNVLKQTHKNWVLIVGDDFSDDPDFRQYLKNRVIELNDKRIIYYDVKEKRELYLYQNFFQEFDYDYYFDLDADDIIDEKILQVYDYHFRKHPNVQSIFSNLSQVNEEGQLLKYYLTQPVDDYVEEFETRTQTKTDDLWENRVSYSMFGHGRCMRRPEGSGMTIMGNQKTSTDSFFLFYNLNRGDHLNIPRNLYTYVRRENSDSGLLTDEESKKFNENANYYLNLYKNKTKRGGWVDIYDDIWNETSALSVCDFLNDVDDITIISEISEENKKIINELYFDKKIKYNDFKGENLVIVYNKLPKNFEWDKIESKNVTIYHYNDDYSYKKSEMFNEFNRVNNQIVTQISKNLNGFTWFNFFRHLIITKK